MPEKKTDLGRLLKGVSFSWIRFVLTIGIGIVQTPLLFKNLQKEELNFWYIFFLFGAFLQMADLGLVQTISRLIAYLDNSHEDTKEETIEKLSNYSPKQIYYTSLVSFFLALLLFGSGIYTFFYFTYEASAHSNTLTLSFIVYIIGIIFTLLSNIPAAMLIGYREVGIDSIIRSVSQIFYFVVLFLLLPYFKSILLVSCAYTLQNIAQFCALHFYFYKNHKPIFKTVSKNGQLIQLDIARQVYNQSLPLFLNQLGGWMIGQGNILVASVIVGSDKISDYSINQQLFTYTTAIALVINQSMGPFIAKYYIKNKFNGMNGLFINTMIVCLAVVGILSIVLVSCGLNIVSLWVGKQHFLGYNFAVVFAIIAFLEVQQSVAGNFVWNTGIWPFNKWTLAAGILTIILGYILGNEYGLLGIAVATLIAKLLTLNWYVVYYGLKRFSITVIRYTFSTLLPIVCLLAFSLVIATLLKNHLATRGFDDLLITTLVSLASGGFFFVTLGLLFRRSFIAMYENFVLKSPGKTQISN